MPYRRPRLSNTASLPFEYVAIAKEQLPPNVILTPFVPVQYIQPGTTRDADFLLDNVRLTTPTPNPEFHSYGMLSSFPLTTTSQTAALAHPFAHLQATRAPIRFHLSTDRGSFPVELRSPLGELMRPHPMTIEAFNKQWVTPCRCPERTHAPHTETHFHGARY